ncbi:unnamed protein product, partial [Nesidiocoris tenuis]
VYLVGHNAPGFDERQGVPPRITLATRHNTRYHNMVRKYAGVVAGQFFGHLHSDSFRIIYDQQAIPGEIGILEMQNSDYCLGKLSCFRIELTAKWILYNFSWQLLLKSSEARQFMARNFYPLNSATTHRFRNRLMALALEGTSQFGGTGRGPLPMKEASTTRMELEKLTQLFTLRPRFESIVFGFEIFGSDDGLKRLGGGVVSKIIEKSSTNSTFKDRKLTLSWRGPVPRGEDAHTCSFELFHRPIFLMKPIEPQSYTNQLASKDNGIGALKYARHPTKG